MNAVDKNNSGSIDYTEWVMATINREQLLSKQRLDIAFKMFDKDGSGTLSIEEIKELFGATSGISENVWRDMLKEADDNGDGNINFNEFKDMMTKLVDTEQKIAIQEITDFEKQQQQQQPQWQPPQMQWQPPQKQQEKPQLQPLKLH